MRTYKVISKIRILTICYASLICILTSFFLIYSSEFPWIAPYLGVLGTVFFVLGAYVICISKIMIDDEKIQSILNFKIFKIIQTVYWKEVSQINVDYIVNPTILTILTFEAPNYTKYGTKEVVHRKMELMPLILPVEFLEDILSKVPVNTGTQLNSMLKNRFIRRYGAEVVQKFDNIVQSAFEPFPKGKISKLKFFMNYLKVYILCLIGFFLYNYFAGHKITSVQEIPALLITAFFMTLVYGIYWWFFGGNATS